MTVIDFKHRLIAAKRKKLQNLCVEMDKVAAELYKLDPPADSLEAMPNGKILKNDKPFIYIGQYGFGDEYSRVVLKSCAELLVGSLVLGSLLAPCGEEPKDNG